ncbi:hypothetical protein ACQP2P_25910 [Dactylosporangium sp. CA-139114]|uniref:hypothetical protein n=1 Tax=Dactylosporangium sp. CA-139114 TaxID=3239931 RepID=UPI003D97F2E8
MSDVLERRYRLLLRVYPAGYRRERAGELLDTLLEAAEPGRTRPEPRQVVALIRGALLVRAGGTGPRRAAVVGWQGAHLAAVAMLAVGAVLAADRFLRELGGEPVPWLLPDAVAAVAPLAALVALLSGAAPLAVPMLVAAVAVPAVLDPTDLVTQASSVVWWAPVLALPLVVAGLRRPADVPAPTRATASVVVAVFVAVKALQMFATRAGSDIRSGLLMAVLAAVVTALLWLGSADPRLLLALAGTVAVRVVTDAIRLIHSAAMRGVPDLDLVETAAVYPVAGAVLVAAAVTISRRQARL